MEILHQRRGIVRDDPIDTQPDHARPAAGLIHGPGHHNQPGFVRPPDCSFRHQLEPRRNAARFGSFADAHPVQCAVRHQCHQRNLRSQIVRGPQNRMVERAQEDPLRHSRPVHGIQNHLRVGMRCRRQRSAFFRLDIEDQVVPRASRQNPIEIRDAGRQFGKGPHHRIVRHGEHAIDGHDHIQFDGIRPALQRMFERRKRVLGMRGACAAMPHDAGPVLFRNRQRRVQQAGIQKVYDGFSMTRRTAIAALSATLSAAAQQENDPAKPKFGYSAPKRTTPMLCMFSGNMPKVHYAEIGDIAAQIGFEGIDLTVMIGGHVDPRITNVDLVRAFESIRGSNLEVPMITTAINTPADNTIYPVLYLTGHSQIQIFRLGLWKYAETGDIRQRLQQVRLDLAQIVSLGQRCGIAAAFPNRAGGFVGEAVWDTQSIIGEMDPRWIGYMFDPAEATAEGGLGGWETALRLTVPRLRAVSLQDFYWVKTGSEWSMQKCPLGQGMVDWDKFFSILAAAHFTGPMSVQIEYAPQNAIGASARDLEFARKHVEQAYSASHS